MLTRDIEPTFCSSLGAPLGHQADGTRLGAQRDRHHLIGGRHFQIERLCDFRFQPRDVAVADVTAVLAKIRGHAVRAGGNHQFGGAHRIGMQAAARIADGRDVIDVDAKSEVGNSRHGNALLNVPRGQPLTRSAAATTFLARN